MLKLTPPIGVFILTNTPIGVIIRMCNTTTRGNDMTLEEANRLEEANKYMEKRLGICLDKYGHGLAHEKYIVIVGFLSEDHAEIKYEVIDGEYYATETRTYFRNQLYDTKTERFPIPRCWIATRQCDGRCLFRNLVRLEE